MGQDARVSTEIFRKDHPMILACLRHQAMILPVRLAYQAGGYKAGTVLAKNTTSGFFQAYNDAGSSGINTAKCILFEDAEPASGDTQIAHGIFKGHVYSAKLTGIDANGITDLGGRTIQDSSGLGDILSF